MGPDNSQGDKTKSFVVLAKDTLVGHYKIISRIGAGGMGEVYLAEDTKLNRTVALKFLSSFLANDTNAKSRFTREAHAAAKINHPNIVHIYEVSEFEDRPYFAMEYIDGDSLRDYAKKRRLGFEEIIGISIQICEGLQEAHRAGVVHRDIKPSNIAIDNSGRVRILDFGLAKVQSDESITRSGSTVGTYSYMSPEQVRGKDIDHRSDIFSFGVVLYELITSKKPFTGSDDASILHSITHDEPEPLVRFKSGVPEHLQRIVDKLLQKDPSLRYHSAADILADLKGASLVKRKATNWKAVSSIAIFLVIIVIAAYYLIRYKSNISSSDLDEIKRIVVLPFENLGKEDQEYFANGITDEVMSRLTSASDVAVVSRISSQKYRNSNKTLKEIGDELGADYVLDASIRWQETSDGQKRMRMVAQLIKVSDDVNLWSKTYDTVITEVFSVQSDIAEKVIEQMGVVLLPTEKKAIWEEKGTSSEEAYDYHLRGREYAWKLGGFGKEREYRLAIEMFKKAIALDSMFALTYLNLAGVYDMLCWYRMDKSDSCKVLAKMFSDKAYQYASDPVVKYGARGGYYYYILNDYENALEYYDKAYEKNKNDVWYLSQTAGGLRRLGRWEESIKRSELANQLEPKNVSHKFGLACDYVRIHKFEKADHLLDTVLEYQPDFSAAYSAKVQLHLTWRGDTHEALEIIKQSEEKLDPTEMNERLSYLDAIDGKFNIGLERITIPPFDTTDYFLEKACMYRRMGQKILMSVYFDSARTVIERELEINPEDPFLRGKLGTALAGLGQNKEALNQANKAMELLPLTKDEVNGSHLRTWTILNIYIFTNELDNAIDLLDTLLSIPGDVSIPLVKIDPEWKVLVQHPQFKELEKKYGSL